jgi:hypothetical protein
MKGLSPEADYNPMPLAIPDTTTPTSKADLKSHPTLAHCNIHDISDMTS